MTCLKLFISVLFQATLLLASILGQGPVIDLGHAKYRGITNETLGYDALSAKAASGRYLLIDPRLNSFFGIPFAQPPVGHLRWRAPAAIEHLGSNRNIIDATKFGPQCIQGRPKWVDEYGDEICIVNPPPAITPNSSEDCLWVDVFTPKKSKLSSLPIMVLIHGGGSFKSHQ